MDDLQITQLTEAMQRVDVTSSSYCWVKMPASLVDLWMHICQHVGYPISVNDISPMPLPRETEQPSNAIYPMIIDASTRSVYYGQRWHHLSELLFNVLLALADQPGKAVDQAIIQEKVWGDSSDPRRVKVAIHGLRQELEGDPHQPRLIKTCWGFGYRLAVGSVMMTNRLSQAAVESAIS